MGLLVINLSFFPAHSTQYSCENVAWLRATRPVAPTRSMTLCNGYVLACLGRQASTLLFARIHAPDVQRRSGGSLRSGTVGCLGEAFV